MHQQKSTSGRRSAFTLIEIMVAAVITIIMIGLVIQITSEVLKVWNRSMGKLSANAEARIAMQLLTSDLESALLNNNGMLWLYAVDADGADLPSIGDYSPQTIELAMFTIAQDRVMRDISENEVPGNISAVQYQLVYQNPVTGDPDPENNTFALHRRLIDPVTTFSSLLGAGNQESFDDWLDAGFDVSGDVSLSYNRYEPAADSDYYLAGNIVDFRVEFVVIDDNGDAQTVPSPVRYGGKDQEGGDVTATVGPFQSANQDFRYPIEYADITMTVLSSEGMEILRNLQLNRGGTGFEQDEGEEVILRHGEVFKRRVHFQAKPF